MSCEKDFVLLMKSITNYEHQIGDLIEKNERLEAELQQCRRERDALVVNRQDVLSSDVRSLSRNVFHLAEQQSHQFDAIYRLLAQSTDERPYPVGRKRLSAVRTAIARSSALAHRIKAIFKGRSFEEPEKIPVDLSKDTALRPLRGTLLRRNGDSCVNDQIQILKENTELGVHSLIVSCAGVDATGFRGYEVVIKPFFLSTLRLRVRESADRKNFCEIDVDMQSLRHDSFRSSLAPSSYNVAIDRLEEDWVRVVFVADLNKGDTPVEIELIPTGGANKKASKRKGSGKDAFALCSCTVFRSNGESQMG